MSLKYLKISNCTLIENILSYSIMTYGRFYDPVLENLNVTQRRILNFKTKGLRDYSTKLLLIENGIRNTREFYGLTTKVITILKNLRLRTRNNHKYDSKSTKFSQ